jgi:hypothetical protein
MSRMDKMTDELTKIARIITGANALARDGIPDNNG